MSDSNDKPIIGSPPLILACLAIGIFSAALISVFGWRRMQVARGNAPLGIDGRGVFGRHEPDSWNNLRERPGVGDRPVMWEVWTDRNARVTSADYGCWDQNMPLALYSYQPDSSNRESVTRQTNLVAPSTTSPPLVAGRRRPFRDLTPTTFFPLYRRTPALSPSIPTDVGEGDEEDEAGRITEVAEKNQTQVVIVVEMPSLVSSRRRHKCHFSRGSVDNKKRYSYYSSFSKSETLVETHDKMREELLAFDYEEGQHQYCIGVHSCPLPVSTRLKDGMEPLRTIQNC